MSNNNENDYEQMCYICHGTTEGSIHKLECGHEFHPTCIITWFRSGYTECPMCRPSARWAACCFHDFLWWSYRITYHIHDDIFYII